MNKKLLILLLIIFCQFSFSQVGIGTTNPNASSALDITSTNAGLLIPRVNLTSTADVITIPSPETSLLIYNRNTTNDVIPGFYYWEGSWKTLKPAASTGSTLGWSLTGNTLSTGTEYLGTNNYYPLVFKVNNNPFARFHPNGGLAIGNSAAANDNNSVAIGTSATATTSNQAVAIGQSSNAAGYQSVAIGLSAATSNNSTVAIGSSTSAAGFQSVAIGLNSSTTQNNGIAIGTSSSATGEQATALGNSANSSAQNATAIGYQATATQTNSVILGSSSNGNNRIGIGTNTPDERLHVAGSVKIVDGTQANNYVLTSDANGKASWKAPVAATTTATISYGEIYRTSNLNLSAGAINFGTNGTSSNVNLGGDNIQVITAGTYRITYTISLRKNSGTAANFEFYLGIYGTEIPGSRSFTTVANGETSTVSVTKLVNLTAYQGILVYSNTTDSNVSVLANGSNLTVELIK